MSTKPYKLTIDQGATFSVSIVWKNSDGTVKDLTGYTAKMQIRENYSEVNPLETLSTSNGEIVITDNTIVMSLPPSRTSAIPVDTGQSSIPPKSKYVYDLELTDTANNVTRLLYGAVEVTAEVTK